jgi:hypothetical protein
MHQDIVKFIRDRYFVAHGASAPVHYQNFMSRMRAAGQGAAVGYRRASDGMLFLENYLDEPVEQVLRRHMDANISRSRIVEIGGLAANSATALIALWNTVACELGSDTDIGVAVLIRPLRTMFRRLGITLHELAPARAERLGAGGAHWGSYYENDPVVCTGSLIEARRRLSGFLARRRGAALA